VKAKLFAGKAPANTGLVSAKTAAQKSEQLFAMFV